MIRWLRDFKDLGLKASDITLLSFRADESSAAFRLKAHGFPLSAAWTRGQQTSFATVHAFKGMENKVVVLTDIVLSEKDFQRTLFYTGMTRGTEYVRVLCHESSKETLAGWLKTLGAG